MYQICNDEDEFEPRITPKPAPKLDCFTVPSVPEVSLIFDKPLDYKTIEHTDFQSPATGSKTLTCKNNVSHSLNTNGSYAAWKQQNYSVKPIISDSTKYTIPQKIQSTQNYVVKSCFTKDISTENLQELNENNSGLRKSTSNHMNYEKDEIHRSDSSYEYSYHTNECNSSPVQKKNVTTACSNRMEQCDHTSPVSHDVRVCTNANNYIVNKTECFPLLYEKRLMTNSHKQQEIPFNDSTNESNIQNSHFNPNTLKRSEYQIPHYVGQQHPYFNMNTYPFSQFHPYSTHSTDNQETVKNLLQIINSQTEQIKSLQIQVERLLKMQEESLKEKKKCSCSYQVQQQHNQFFANSNDTVNTSNHTTIPKSPQKNICQSELCKNKRQENYNENESINQNELLFPETQAKKTFMEQKVSIGVMTSFEFTVQNSPLTLDMDDCEKINSQQKKENLKVCSNVGIRDSNESLRRYKNSFTRIPSAQLENIVEDSESYMSSSQQQSSNLNASTSTKDLERYVYVDVQKEADTVKSESPKPCTHIITNLNQTEGSVKKNIGRTYMKEIRCYENVRKSGIQKGTVSTDYNGLENKSSKANTPINTNQYKKLKMKKDNDSVNNSDYYRDYKKESQIIATKGINCIGDSLILNGGDLNINERPPPTPEPSIHVDMHEYSSDDDSEKVKRSSKVGWTFYNNVLGQVNQLLQNSCVIDDQQESQAKVNQNERNETENKAVLDTVKNATLEQLKKLGISLNENSEVKELNSSNKMAFDLSFYPRLDYQTNMTQTTSAVNETNTSMHMKALALKYLTDEQLAELAVQQQGSTSLKHLMVSNVQGTNMSFATMRYLERYQLLPGKNNFLTEDVKVPVETPPEIDLTVENSKNGPKVLERFPFSQMPKTSCPSKILDISTLKQQPKLL